MKNREAVVAGQFYADSCRQLQAEIDSFLNSPIVLGIRPRALIVPHAGYCYSGAVAGRAYAYLKPLATEIKRVILLGPSHRVALRGCALSSCETFTAPFGKINVAAGCNEALLALEEVSVNDSAHQWEHGLEVQLPFLQYCLDDFKIVPIVVGYCQPRTVSHILSVLQVNDSSTLVVVSSDLSHYHPYQEAQALDNLTIDRILNYDNSLAGEDACGCFAVNGLLDYANNEKWQIQLINKANSGDVLGSKKEVVGYASFIFY